MRPSPRLGEFLPGHGSGYEMDLRDFAMVIAEERGPGWVPEPDDVILPGLIEALESQDQAVRARAEETLRRVDPARTKKWFRKEIESNKGSLGRLAGAAARAGLTEVVPEIVGAALTAPSAHELEQVGAALASFPHFRELMEHMSPRDRTLEGPGPSAEQPREVAPVTTRPDTTPVRAASRPGEAEAMLKDARVATRLEGLELLRGGGRAEMALLVKALHDRSPRVAEKAVALLGESRAPEALALLWSAMQGVSRDRQRPILEALRAFERGAVVMLAHQSLGSRQVRDRALAVWVLGELGHEGSRPLLLKALSDPAPEVRSEALTALALDPRGDITREVAQRLQDPEESIRLQSIRLLSTVESPRVLPHLLEAAKDPSAPVRAEAATGLLARDPQLVAQVLLPSLGTPAYRRVARELLAQLGPAITSALVEGLPDATPEVRALVGEVLRDTGSVPALIEELEDPDPQRRLLAVRGLKAAGGEGVSAALVGRLADPVTRVRQEVAEALAERGDEDAVEPLKRAFVGDPALDVVAAIEVALRRLAGISEEDAGP